MTPARTETTLRQGRKAFNHISLNNSHPNTRTSFANATRSRACPTATARANDERQSNNTHGEYTREQLISWLMSKDAIAFCFIKDVLSLSESEHGGFPYCLLGRIPCRSVSLVAIVVGTAAYERRIVYTLDDGTGTIECAFRLDENKPESKASEKQVVTAVGRVSTEKFTNLPSPTSRLIPVGSVVNVQGRVRVKQNSRDIYGESIERCKGMREELEHWRRVISLHKNHYFLPERFVIPSSPSTTGISAPDLLSTPKSAKATTFTPNTPSTASSSSTSSPVRSSEDPSLPQRLRHPSRLHSRDVTGNTFRIYVKHFMDNLRYLNVGPKPCEDDLTSDPDSIATAIDKAPATPTKKRRTSDDERTPRLPCRASNLTTPRARACPTLHLPGRERRDEKEAVIGCTLSFLLRVPELATLASRVVQAEARRREEAGQSQPGAAASVSSSAGKHRTLPSSAGASAPKVERLFSWAIRKLYQDGSIILWDGPALSVLEPHEALDSSALYRSSQLNNDGRSNAVSARFASTRGTQPTADYIEDLSDPPSDEEAYAPLSTAYLAAQVEDAIRSLTAPRTARTGGTENTYLGPAISRRRLLPLPGPTKEDIMVHIKRRDDRWKRINGWAVQEALEWLRDNGRAWSVSEDGGGRWELCS
ncbi:hypothetical protein F5148DRAFT_1157141 [Russula earlei]|uniref:Uncharacterized protein n=1 Tax=Russula earlei TaxID=71964 RepID=A0ACC0UP14_9AGAM|nr:hypothetical protein F5148DRAFT_1157141 [Russula earlei]